MGDHVAHPTGFDPQRVVLLHGQLEEDAFALDFAYPLSPLHAFAISLSSYQWLFLLSVVSVFCLLAERSRFSIRSHSFSFPRYFISQVFSILASEKCVALVCIEYESSMGTGVQG